MRGRNENINIKIDMKILITGHCFYPQKYSSKIYRTELFILD